jgi:hypothetical protein
LQLPGRDDARAFEGEVALVFEGELEDAGVVLPGGDGDYVDGDADYRKAVILTTIYLLDIIFATRRRVRYAVLVHYEA